MLLPFILAHSLLSPWIARAALERSGSRSALPSFGTDPVFTGPEARYVVTVEAAGARCAVPADFDGDGDMDLVSVSSSDNTVSWYERLDDGSYGAKNMISRASNGARIVTVGDIDLDNRTDVIVASYYDHTVGWFRNIGGSTANMFGPMNVITRTAISAQGVSVADIDNDGDLDVLSASSGDNTIAWYENLEGGKFCEVKKIIDAESLGIRTVIAVDLNSDGFLDLAAASKDDNTVAVYMNNQQSEFTKIIVDSSAGGAYSVVAADVDQDGRNDLVVAANAAGKDANIGEGGKVLIYRNRFAAGSDLVSFDKVSITADDSSDLDWFVLSVWAGDLDMDGDIDVASASFGLLHQGSVSWYENIDGVGNSWARHKIYVTEGVKTGHYVYGADMDGDGDNDLIVTTNGDNTVQILSASTRCDNSVFAPMESCCIADRHWNGATCVSCQLGTFWEASAGRCEPCSAACPRLGLAFQPTTCQSMSVCGNSSDDYARCDCGQDKYFDFVNAICVSCPDGHITFNDTIRTESDYKVVQASQLDNTKFLVPDATSWRGFNVTRCMIPTCVPGSSFSMIVHECLPCEAGTFSVGGAVTECTVCPAGFQCAASTSVPWSCRPGYYSPEGSAQCLQSPVGSATVSAGMSGPEPCDIGTYEDEPGSQRCKPCALGTYSDAVGQTACSSCADGKDNSELWTTMKQVFAHEEVIFVETESASNVTACGCKRGARMTDTSAGCVECELGLQCELLGFPPTSTRGFAMLVDVDLDATNLDVWKCVVPSSCPGGEPGTCAFKREGLACAKCPDGMEGGLQSDCTPCATYKRVLVWFVWAVAVIGCVVAYYCLNSPVTSKATALLCTTCAFGMSMSMLQSLGVLSLLAFPWPESVTKLLAVAQIVMLDVEVASLGCAYGTNAAEASFLTSVTVFFIIVGIILALWAASHVLPSDWQWSLPKTLNTIGQFFQIGFTTMSAIALTPMMCYGHPNGSSSVLKYPEVLCGTEDHSTLLFLAAPLLILALFFYVTCVVMAAKAPQMVAAGDVKMMQSMRFLFFRFRVDCWWWGCVLMLKSLLVSLAPVILADDGRAQMLFVLTVILGAMILQIFFWPWKVPLLNILDAVISCALLLIVVGVNALQSDATAAADDGASAIEVFIIAMVVTLYGSCFLMLLMSIVATFYRGSMGGVNDFFLVKRPPNLNVLSERLYTVIDISKDFPAQGLKSWLDHLPIYDIWAIEKMTAIMEQSGFAAQSDRFGAQASQAKGRQSFFVATNRAAKKTDKNRTAANQAPPNAVADPAPVPVQRHFSSGRSSLLMDAQGPSLMAQLAQQQCDDASDTESNQSSQSSACPADEEREAQSMEALVASAAFAATSGCAATDANEESATADDAYDDLKFFEAAEEVGPPALPRRTPIMHGKQEAMPNLLPRRDLAPCKTEKHFEPHPR